jgi:hypothetical protein
VKEVRGPVTVFTAIPTSLSPAATGVDTDATGAEAECEAEEAEEALAGTLVTANSPPLVELAMEVAISVDEGEVDTTEGSGKVCEIELSASTEGTELDFADPDATAEVIVAEALVAAESYADEDDTTADTDDSSRPVEDALVEGTTDDAPEDTGIPE